MAFQRTPAVGAPVVRANWCSPIPLPYGGRLALPGAGAGPAAKVGPVLQGADLYVIGGTGFQEPGKVTLVAVF